MHRMPVGRRLRVGTVTVIVCICCAGCGGGDDEPGATPSGDGSSAQSNACPALARFSNTLDATVDAISNGGDVHDVQGSLAGLKNEYLSTLETLQAEAPHAADDLSAEMQDLQNAASRLPRDASPDRVSNSLQPHVTAVRATVEDTAAMLDCPTS
jgi:hypothetical protein